MRHLLLVLALAPGCFTPEAPVLTVDELGYETAYTSSPDIVLRPFTYDGLLCPDGTSATFYALYRTGLTGPAPLVIAFHGGSFDYVKSPIAEDPLYGQHYADDNRLTGDWANRRVFETLGLLSPDPTEVSLGTLPAALAEAGTVTLYPANCWGDLWHNEFGYERNAEDEYLSRNGRALAWAMVALASADADTAQHWRDAFGFDDIPVDVDTASGIYMVGVAEGGRALMEVLRREQLVASLSGASALVPPLRGMIVDSLLDNLSPVVRDYAGFPGLNDGIARIYPDDYTGNIGWWSLASYLDRTGLEGTLQVYWSSNNPQVPEGTLASLEGLYAANPFGDSFYMLDSGLQQHGYLNGDVAAAKLAVDRMLGP